MIIPDLNLIVHAYNQKARLHAGALAWWEELLSGERVVGLPWAVALGFLRLTTRRPVFEEPFSAAEACERVESWLAQPNVMLVHPGELHRRLVLGFLVNLGTAGNLTTDAHLAALAIEHQAELHSTDTDFARFPGLRWRNPLELA